MTEHESRLRRQTERWLSRQKGTLTEHWASLREQLLPTSWPARCARAASLLDGGLGRWQPQPGSSSAELALLLEPMPLPQRQLLGSLLDAPAAGVLALVEAVERLDLGWRQRLDPLHSHRQYAAQLETLVRLLGLIPAARSAYLENERRIFPAIDSLLFESLPLRLRTDMANRHEMGDGACLQWWLEQLMARAGMLSHDMSGQGEDDWPTIPPAWLALAWIISLRRTPD